MTLISFKCIPGDHSVNVQSPAGNPVVYPAGWRLMSASHLPGITLSADDPFDPGIWYFDPTSTTTVLVCPEHDLIRVDTPNQ